MGGVPRRRPRSTPVRSTAARSFESARAMLRAMIVRRRARAELADATVRGRGRSRRGARGATRRSVRAAEALPARRRPRPGATILFAEFARWTPRARTPETRSSTPISELAILGDRSRGQCTVADERVVRAARAPIDETPYAGLLDSACSVFAAAAAPRGAPGRARRSERTTSSSKAMRMRPSCTSALPALAVRVRPADWPRSHVVHRRRDDRPAPAPGDR